LASPFIYVNVTGKDRELQNWQRLVDNKTNHPKRGHGMAHMTHFVHTTLNLEKLRTTKPSMVDLCLLHLP